MVREGDEGFPQPPGRAACSQPALLAGGAVRVTAEAAGKESEDSQDGTMEDRSEIPLLGGGGKQPKPSKPEGVALFRSRT